MKNLFLILTCLIGLNIFAQQTQIEIAPNSNINPDAVISRDTFNLQFSFPCAAFIGEYGVETNGTDIYVSQWLDDSIARYDQSRNVLETFVIPGVGNVRDMAYDGQYYYGSPSDFYFYVLDLDNKVLIDTIQTSFRIRGMAYDSVEDVLWASEHWTPMFYKMDMQGNILDSWFPTGVTLNYISGLAYDNYSVGGPFLWGFSQDSTGAIIIKYDIASQSQTGNMIDVSGLANSIAGGLFINQMSTWSGFTMGGMIQNELVFAFDLDYANMLVVGIDSHDMITSLDIYPNPANDVLNIKIEIDNQAELSCKILNQVGQVIQDHIVVNGSSTITINTSMLESGVYFVQIGNKKGYSFTKKFLITK